MKLILLILASLMTIATAQWVPPIGIPDPADTWGGIDPIDDPVPTTATHCPSWPTAASGSATGGSAYYIDKFHVSATDTANTYGYPDKPRLTVPLNKLYLAGDYIEIHGDGTTGNAYPTSFRPRGLGTVAAPIWFVGVSGPNVDKINFGFSDFAETAYMLFDGLNTIGTGAVEIRPRYVNNSIHDIAFRNCTFTGTQSEADSTAISVGGASTSATYRTTTTQDIVFYNCDVSDYGLFDNPGEEVGVYPLFYLSRMWFVDGSVFNCAEDGFGGSHAGQWTTTGYYIGRNDIYDNLTNAIDIKAVGKNATDGGVVISENNIWGHFHQEKLYTSGTLYSGGTYRFRDVSGSPDFSNVGAGAGPYSIAQSFVCTSTAAPTDWGTASVSRNISSGQGEAMSIHTAGESTSSNPEYYNSYPADVTVINNTIYDARTGVWVGGCGDIRVSGNVIYGMDSDGGTYPSYTYTYEYDAIKLDRITGNAWVTHNTIYDCDGGIKVEYPSTAYSATTNYWRSNRVTYLDQHYSVIEDVNSPETCTFDAGTDLITFSAVHNKTVAGEQIAFQSTGDLPGGLDIFQIYEVDTVPTTTTMTIRNAITNTPIDITDAGTGTHTWRGLLDVLPTDTDYWKPLTTEIVGNVISNRPEPNYDIRLVGFGSAANSITMDNNLVYSPGGEVYEIEGTTDRTLAYVQANTAYEANSLNTAPLFTNAVANDFSLTASSPPRDAAIEGGLYVDFTTQYPAFGAISYDRGLLARPDNAIWDIGAYEYDSANPPVTGGTATATSATVSGSATFGG